MKDNISTKVIPTWCPGCTNFHFLFSVKKALSSIIAHGTKKENLAMVAGIGCHAKIFDALDISGVYGLHGRALPLALGMKLGNPKLKLIIFSGDGDCYAEGMEHFIHAFRHNATMTLIVNNNRDFSLTGGQATPSTQLGFKTKSEPLGELENPINPMKLALASGGTFIARCNARDVEHTAEIIEKAMNHKGFSFIEMIQDCIIFNNEMNNLDSLMYKVDNKDMKKAHILVDEWDYNKKSGKIPIGILYQGNSIPLEDKWPQLKK